MNSQHGGSVPPHVSRDLTVRGLRFGDVITVAGTFADYTILEGEESGVHRASCHLMSATDGGLVPLILGPNVAKIADLNYRDSLGRACAATGELVKLASGGRALMVLCISVDPDDAINPADGSGTPRAYAEIMAGVHE